MNVEVNRLDIIYNNIMNFDEFLKLFKNYSQSLNIDVNEEKIKKFYLYMNLLIEWNDKINLTAITEPKEVIIKHFIDSLTIADKIENNSKIIDVGTGAGFPGIPLKIFNDTLNVTLLDSLNKRTIFLNEVIKKLNLKNIEVIHGRAEDYAKITKYRAEYDYAVSRAVAPLNILLEYLSPYVKVNGNVNAMKGCNAEEEIKNSSNALNVLRCKIIKNEKMNLPENAGERYIMVIQKVENTPKAYPRNAGIPKKKPL